MTDPDVHIAGYRDPDGDVTTVVFVNGKEVTPSTWIVDPGAGYPYLLSEWREHLRDLETVDGPPAWKDALVDFYRQAEEPYTERDIVTARNMQPDVDDLDALDPDRWTDNGITERPQPDLEFVPPPGTTPPLLHEPPTTNDQAEYNNTVKAGWAITALKAYMNCAGEGQFEMPAELAERDEKDGGEFFPAPDRTHKPVAAAAATYRQLTKTDTLTETVTDLLADLRHLADATDRVLAKSADDDKDPLHAAMVWLVTDLLIAGRGVWRDALDESIDDIADNAYQHYVDEVTTLE